MGDKEMKVKYTGNGFKLITENEHEEEILGNMVGRKFMVSKIYQDIFHNYLKRTNPYVFLEREEEDVPPT